MGLIPELILEGLDSFQEMHTVLLTFLVLDISQDKKHCIWKQIWYAYSFIQKSYSKSLWAKHSFLNTEEYFWSGIRWKDIYDATLPQITLL